MMEQKIDTPNLGFWILDFIYFHMKTRNLTKISWVQEKMESVDSRQSNVIIIF